MLFSSIKKKNLSRSFTLVELLVVISIVGLLSSVIIISTNRIRVKARDAKRQLDIINIEKALLLYLDKYGQFPWEDYCDSSIGSCAIACPCAESHWTTSSGVWQGLVVSCKIISTLPEDPINNSTYYYYYEPCCSQDCGGGRTCTGNCCEYEIGAVRLEATGSKYSRWGRF